MDLQRETRIENPVSPLQADVANTAKAEALRRLLRMGIVGTGVGGLLGVTGALSNKLKKVPVDKAELTTSDVTIPVPTKRAVDAAPGQSGPDWADQAVSKLMPSQVGVEQPSTFSPSWLRGDASSAPHNIPWYIPAAMATTAGSLFGTNALVSWLARKKEKADINHELGTASKEYDRALHRLSKGASDEEGCWEKLASLSDIAGSATGVYGALAAILGSAAAYKAYKAARKHDPNAIMDDVLQERARVRAMASPPPIRLEKADIPMTATSKGLL